MRGDILVVGGTGDLGQPVVRRLLADGYRVRLLVRGTHGAPAGLDHPHLEPVRGDVDDAGSLRRAMDGCTGVHVSLRGGPSAEQYDRVEHQGTARVAEVAAERGVARITYVSHMLAGQQAGAPDLRAKHRAEEAIVRSGVPYTVFRPTYFMETLPKQVKGGRAVVLGRRHRPFHLVAADDFAAMVSRAFATAGAARRCLYVHGPEAITVQDALRAYCAAFAPGARVVSMPLWFVSALNRVVLHGQLSGTLPLMRAMQRLGERGDPAETNRLLGAPPTTLGSWIRRGRGPDLPE